MFSLIEEYKEKGDISGLFHELKEMKDVEEMIEAIGTEVREKDVDLYMMERKDFPSLLSLYFNKGFVSYHHFFLTTVHDHPEYVAIFLSCLEKDVKENRNISFYKDLYERYFCKNSSSKVNKSSCLNKCLNKLRLLEYTIFYQNLE